MSSSGPESQMGSQAPQRVSGVELGAEDYLNALSPPRGQQLAALALHGNSEKAWASPQGCHSRVFISLCPASKYHPQGDQETQILATFLGHTN